jgi:hypothetical protein
MNRYARTFLPFTLAVLAAVFLPLLAHAATAEYQPLTAIPYVPQGGNAGLPDYINAIFLLSLSLGAILAVIKIAVGGFQYMMSEVVTSKAAAKQDIYGALIGLAILMASVVVLKTIYPDLVSLDILSRGTPVQLESEPTTGVSQSGGSTVASPSDCPEGTQGVMQTHTNTNVVTYACK